MTETFKNAVAAFKTLTAPSWKLWLAQLFGERSEGQDGDLIVVCHRWRGVTYLTSTRNVSEPHVFGE